MERWMTAKVGWVWFLGTAAIIDALWPSDQLLSKGFDRFRERHPILAWWFILATAAHFLRVVPPRVDVYGLVYLLRPARHWIKRHTQDPDDWFAVDLDEC